MSEDGHIWGIDNRCVYCQMQTRYYYEVKVAAIDQPERQDLKDWAKCSKSNANQRS